MRKFEYRVEKAPFSVRDLDALGEEGWELVSVVVYGGSFYHYFKREAYDGPRPVFLKEEDPIMPKEMYMVVRKGVPYLEVVRKGEFQKVLVDDTWKPDDREGFHDRYIMGVDPIEPAKGDDTFGYGLDPVEPANPEGDHICRDRGNGCNICGKR